ncbi:MAG: ATP-binding protein [Alphaproteobacteria bacterium]
MDANKAPKGNDTMTKPTLIILDSVSAARAFSATELAFRAPHYTVSDRAMAEEIALAAGGVLVLDEPNEYSRSAIETIARLVPQMHERVRPKVVAIVRDAYDADATAKRASLYEGWGR